MLFLPVELEKRAFTNLAYWEPQESIYGYLTIQVLVAVDLIQVKSHVGARQNKIREPQWFMGMVLDELELTCNVTVGDSTRCNAELSFFSDMCLIIVIFLTESISVQFITAYLREDHVFYV